MPSPVGLGFRYDNRGKHYFLTRKAVLSCMAFFILNLLEKEKIKCLTIITIIILATFPNIELNYITVTHWNLKNSTKTKLTIIY